MKLMIYWGEKKKNRRKRKKCILSSTQSLWIKNSAIADPLNRESLHYKRNRRYAMIFVFHPIQEILICSLLEENIIVALKTLWVS
mmetsp:Transcript_15011/g.19695  ORF Transcript_15011/g.19695 Transcript_15011/m.19695 type:complete len:85 (-) Transcript_15011:954-1208(-)